MEADAPPDEAALRVVFPRRADVEYDIEHRAGSFYVRINDTGRNFRLVKVDAARPDLGRAEELIAARDRVMLDDFDLFAEDLVVTERVDGNLQLRVLDLVRGGEHTVAFDEPAYAVHTSGNAEFETRTLRFVYNSMTTPASTYDYQLASRERVLRKRQPVPGYDPALYQSDRIMARAADGTEIPISLVWRRDQKRTGPQPLLLYGYGSYGIPLDPGFSQTRVSLLDRGVVFAIAHIRGGGDLGRTWYEAGKMAKKATTFSDFIACAETLIARGLTTPEQLAIEGGSAGGLLMGVVVNQRPELFKAVVAEVPFVDVINTHARRDPAADGGRVHRVGQPQAARAVRLDARLQPLRQPEARRLSGDAGAHRPERHPGRVLGAGQVRGPAAHPEDRRQPAAPQDQSRGRPRRRVRPLRLVARDRRGRRVPAGRARPR